MTAGQSSGTIQPKSSLVMVITGNGKGKTTAAFGQALRAVGQGYKVCVIQFMKGRKYGEVLAAEQYLADLTIIQAGQDSFVMRDQPSAVDVELARQGFEQAREAVHCQKYDMVILDEINVAVDFQLIAEDDVLDLVKNKPAGVDLILTGRYASKRMMDQADLVSEVLEIKHPYHTGVEGRAGIEY